MDDTIVVSKTIPAKYQIDLSGDHLYYIGLSLFPLRETKRKPFHNPYFFFVFALFHTSRCIVAMLLPPEADRIFFAIGDYPHYMNIGFHYNICYMFCGFITIAIQCLHFWYRLRDIRPIMRPFEMMSGLVTPKSIGLNNVNDVESLLKRSKALFQWTKQHIVSFTMSATGLSLTLILIDKPLIDKLLISVPWIAFHGTAAYIFCILLTYQMIYFHLICFYVRLKLRQVNSTVTKLKKTVNNASVVRLLHSINSTHKELTELNVNFWSDFLFVFISLLFIVISTALYSVIFGNLTPFLKFFSHFVNVFFMTLLAIVLNDSSSVAFESFKAYKLLSQLFSLKSYQTRVNSPLKVKVIIRNNLG